MLSSDNNRLEGLRKKLHIINAEILRASSKNAEEKAQQTENTNPLEAKNQLRQALEAERTIQNKWIYSGMADIGKIARLDTRLRRLEAIPLWEKTRECEKQAEEYFKSENIDLAVDSIKEAIKIENTFLEKYRDVLNTEFSRIDRLGIRKETYLSYPQYKELITTENSAIALEKDEQWEGAVKLWNQAIEQQKQIIIKNKTIEVNNYIDSISLELLLDPVIASDGLTYERNYIQRVIDTTGISPKTRDRLTNILIPNEEFRRQINELVLDYLKING